MRKALIKRILAMVTCLLMIFTIMPDMATAKKDAGTGSGISTSTWNTISIPGSIIHVPQCKKISWKVENANFIVASKTNSEKDKGFIVWTLNELNDRAKADIIKAICRKSTWADFKKLDDNILPVTFTFGDTSKLQEPLKNVVIKPEGNGIQIDFDAEKVWTKYMYGTYIYTPEPTTIELTAEKLLKNENNEKMQLNGGEFTFVLKGAEGDAYTTNDVNGHISFTVSFDKPGDYEYTIMEVDGQQIGYIYDEKELKYNVNVNDEDDDGKLVAIITKSPEDDEFTNTYDEPDIAPVEVKITAAKKLNDADDKAMDLEDGQFTFLLYEGETVNKDKLLDSTTNDKDGNISFTRTFTEEEEGEHYFTVAEANDGKTGYTYSETTFTYKVTVTKDDTSVDNKALKASVELVKPENVNEAVFTNYYVPLSTTEWIIATKVLEDADGNNMDIKEGQFQFQLKDETGKVIETVGNADDGSITFSAITYDKAATCKYTVNEVIPDVIEEGYTYDKAVFNYEVVVRDDGGQLVAEVHAPDDTTFNNSYELVDIPDEPTPLSAGGIIATKVLEGKKLDKNQFQFQLRDEEGRLIETVYNAEDGKIIFSPIEYTKAGTYIYKVNEVNAGEEGYTYDKSVFEYKVVIEEKDENLVATVYAPEDTTFNNSYELVDIPDDPVPQTGDALNKGVYMMAALATLCVAAFIISRKHKVSTNNR